MPKKALDRMTLEELDEELARAEADYQDAWTRKRDIGEARKAALEMRQAEELAATLSPGQLAALADVAGRQDAVAQVRTLRAGAGAQKPGEE